MLVVAGLSLRNLQPRVWESESPYYLPDLRAVMVSYADFHASPVRRLSAMKQGLRSFLKLPATTNVYLDNGAFSFLRAGGEVLRPAYEEFVKSAQPDWYAIPQDYIPTPQMSDEEQRVCLHKTMEVNRAYSDDGYVPIIHVSRQLERYLDGMRDDLALRNKQTIGLGAAVPNLLRMRKAMRHDEVLRTIRRVRTEMATQQLHMFGVGGTATIHLTALLGVDSVDSAGWRNRAARGIVQLPGRGDRTVADLGNWRGRSPNEEEQKLIAACTCPACGVRGAAGLAARGLEGFCNRATHNLWVLLREAALIEQHLADDSYARWFDGHLDNSIYLPLIRQALALR